MKQSFISGTKFEQWEQGAYITKNNINSDKLQLYQWEQGKNINASESRAIAILV